MYLHAQNNEIMNERFKNVKHHAVYVWKVQGD